LSPRLHIRSFPKLRGGSRAQLTVFLAAYLVYDAARWIFSGDLDQARSHADWIIDLERSAHVAIEASVQHAFAAGPVSWVLSNVYLAAQLVVLPVSLVWLYRRSRPVYRRLRDTVIATWLIAVPIFALFPVAPPRLAGIGIVDNRQPPGRRRTDGALDALLQPVRRRPEPARRLRLRDRHRRRRGPARPMGQGARPALGPARHPRGPRHGQTTTSSTSSPACSSPAPALRRPHERSRTAHGTAPPDG